MLTIHSKELKIIRINFHYCDSDFSSCDNDNSDDVMIITMILTAFIVIKTSINHILFCYKIVCACMYYICFHILQPFFYNLHCLVRIMQKHTTSIKTNFHFHYEKHSSIVDCSLICVIHRWYDTIWDSQSMCVCSDVIVPRPCCYR